jgi:hypothetical protein
MESRNSVTLFSCVPTGCKWSFNVFFLEVEKMQLLISGERQSCFSWETFIHLNGTKHVFSHKLKG